MTTVWRLHLKTEPPDQDTVTYEAVRQFCLAHNIAAVGWPVGQEGEHHDDYLRLAKKAGFPNWGSCKSTTRRLSQDIKPGDFIWTRNRSNDYYLGKVPEGARWRYVSSDEYYKYNIGSLIRCQWKLIGREHQVPGAVVNRFIRGWTLQCINDPNNAVLYYSHYIYDGSLPKVTTLQYEDLFHFLHPNDYEDIVALYLQKEKGYFLIPSTAKLGTQQYEYELLSQQGDHTAVVQCKTDEHLDLADYESLYGKKNTKVFLFSLTGTIAEKQGSAERLLPKDMLEFIRRNRSIMPGKIRHWMDLIAASQATVQ